MMKTRTWLIGLGLLFCCACLGIFWVMQKQTAGDIANIYQDGTCIRSIPLGRVDAPYDFVVEGPHGFNRIRVEPGRICISDSDCPDHICMHQGWISNSVMPIVCLPHKLVIKIEGESGRESTSEAEVDAVSQ